jgi:hypothetical protein
MESIYLKQLFEEPVFSTVIILISFKSKRVIKRYFKHHIIAKNIPLNPEEKGNLDWDMN